MEYTQPDQNSICTITVSVEEASTQEKSKLLEKYMMIEHQGIIMIKIEVVETESNNR